MSWVLGVLPSDPGIKESSVPFPISPTSEEGDGALSVNLGPTFSFQYQQTQPTHTAERREPLRTLDRNVGTNVICPVPSCKSTLMDENIEGEK